ncbi:hypothetical protein [Bartonella refiksaydamii]|uniref:hypothetical protein n=1 Tax=Bartonella refiksaydamii TaxID=2654951 RepID=UPI0012EB8DF8|nr:hypothetical protein [Bartonella refiksaydamii]
MDSSAEISNSFFHPFNLITDKSGKAHFLKKNHPSEKAKTADGGIYVYGLKKRGEDGSKKN